MSETLEAKTRESSPERLTSAAPRDAAEAVLRVEKFIRVCRLNEIPVLGARVVKGGSNDLSDIALFRTGDDRVFALLDRCPHKGGPLSQGIVFGDRVACPLHNWTIELGNGCAVAPDKGCTPTFAVRIVGDWVHIAAGDGSD